MLVSRVQRANICVAGTRLNRLAVNQPTLNSLDHNPELAQQETKPKLFVAELTEANVAGKTGSRKTTTDALTD